MIIPFGARPAQAVNPYNLLYGSILPTQPQMPQQNHFIDRRNGGAFGQQGNGFDPRQRRLMRDAPAGLLAAPQPQAAPMNPLTPMGLSAQNLGFGGNAYAPFNYGAYR